MYLASMFVNFNLGLGGPIDGEFDGIYPLKLCQEIPKRSPMDGKENGRKQALE